MAPFPSARVHQNGTIVNAVDLYLDTNGTLWVLDSGYVNTLRRPVKEGPPKVIALDADTGKILKEIDISSVVRGKAGYLSVDERARGPKYLYISDGPSRSIAVWNIGTHKGHVVVLPKLVKKRTGFSVLYTVLIRRKLYLTYFGSNEIFYIDSDALQKGGKIVKVGMKDPRMVILGSKGYNIIFRLAGRPEIISWDTRQKLLEKNLEVIDKGSLEMNPMAVVQGYGRLWVLESNLHSYLNGSRTTHNFRLI
ncbi:hypothetical protein O3M35_002752 [Rhynocoris fuscipes]|uniref:Adipocyte plasma membrane-associated protein n=1 Tax=Rhynocoris fuscipes TaxID=488301 RepID=A0AAW1CQI9_9HEMI